MQFIGITQRLVEHTTYKETRECLSMQWGMVFTKILSGFIPVPLSYSIEFAHYAPFLSGVIFSGGNDLAMLNPHELSCRRDDYEYAIIKYAIAHQMPLLGVCRGAQCIASYFGSLLDSCSGHVGEHYISVQKENEISYKDYVNSFHNYAIYTLADELCPIAFADDKSIEAFRHKSMPIFGMLWHIERELEHSVSSCMILDEFINALKKDKI